MANWIQNCKIRNDGLCIRMEELKETNLSERRVAEIMMDEALDLFPDLKEDFSAKKIRDRYRYHMKGKKVAEIPPPDSPFAGWPMCKVCGKKRVEEQMHWHNSGKPLEPQEHGLCGKCRWKKELEEGPKCKICGVTLSGTVYGHGLCKVCRKKELRGEAQEDAYKRLDERQKEIDATPVDTEVDETWIHLISKWGPLDTVGKTVYGKVGEETLGKIQDFRDMLFDLIHVVDEVIKESEVSVKVK